MSDNRSFPQVLLVGNGINRKYSGVDWETLLKGMKEPEVNIPEGYELKSPMPLQAIMMTNDNVNKHLKDKHDSMFGKVTNEDHKGIVG